MSFKKSLRTSKGESSNPGLPTEDHNITSGVSATSGQPKKTAMRICRVLCGDVYTSKRAETKICRELVEIACTPQENSVDFQKSCKGEATESLEAITESDAWDEPHLKHPKTQKMTTQMIYGRKFHF